jgi:hypothetical protein
MASPFPPRLVMGTRMMADSTRDLVGRSVGSAMPRADCIAKRADGETISEVVGIPTESERQLRAGGG